MYIISENFMSVNGVKFEKDLMLSLIYKKFNAVRILIHSKRMPHGKRDKLVGRKTREARKGHYTLLVREHYSKEITLDDVKDARIEYALKTWENERAEYQDRIHPEDPDPPNC